LNLNTIPEGLIPRILPLSAAEANQLVESRKEKPFRNMGDVLSVVTPIGLLQEEYYTFLPKGDVQIRIFSTASKKSSIIGVIAQPLSTRLPWVIDYRYQSERKFDFPNPARAIAPQYLEWKLASTP
jgi:hypothetical protein